MRKLLLLVLAVLLFVALPLVAQDDTGEAEGNFGNYNLTGDFELVGIPDPFIVTMRAGGDVDAAEAIGEGCTGYVTENPDVYLNWTPGENTSALRVFFISESDTTLIIQLPDGTFVCNDDNEIDDPAADPLSPAIDLLDMPEGTYGIWVGTFEESTFVSGYLMLTELVNTFPGQITSTFLGQIVAP